MSSLFSVVIPSYNRKTMVEETVNSVLNQTFQNFEIILVDDGSTDGSFEQLSKLYLNEKRVKIIKQANLERGAARNNGLKEALGEYVQFLDSDDKLLPHHLEVLNETVKRLHPDFISTKFEFAKDGDLVPSDGSLLREGYYDYSLFLNGNPFACNVCIRKSNPKLRLFEEDRKYSIKEDWMFLMENLSDQKIYLVDKVTVHLLEHEGRSMHGNNTELIKKTQLAEEWILKRIELNAAEIQILKSHVNYFSAIHSYIDGHKKAVFRYLWRAVQLNGVKMKYLILAIKNIPGHNILNKCKGLLRG